MLNAPFLCFCLSLFAFCVLSVFVCVLCFCVICAWGMRAGQMRCGPVQSGGIMLNAPFLTPHYIPLSPFWTIYNSNSNIAHRYFLTQSNPVTHPLPMIFVRKFYGKASNPLSFTGSGTRRPFRLVKQY